MPNKIQIRSFANLEYGDPHDFLIRLKSFELENDLLHTPKRIRTLRTNPLESVREIRDAALFCVGMSEFLGHKVYFSPSEAQDYDFVARYSDGFTIHYCPVQLKEIVPAELNPDASIQTIINKLINYSDLSSITVVIRLNRKERFEPVKVSIPENIKIGGLWVYGSISPDQREWCLWGDFCSGDAGITYYYPGL